MIDWYSLVLTSFFNGLGTGAGLGLGAYFISKLFIDKLEVIKKYWRGEKKNEN